MVVVGASAGGVEAISTLVRALPPNLPVSVFVVLHVLSTGKSVLPHILSRAGTLPAAHAEDGEHIEHGRIYVAPPNAHMLVERGRLHLARGPKENGHRPAIDPLFRSAARAYESRVVGVVLSGVLDDGSAGLLRVKVHGGTTIVQDPEDALYPAMPENAIAHVRPHQVLPLAEIAAALIELAHQPAGPERAIVAPKEMTTEHPSSLNPQPGEPSGFTCPECGGALWESEEGNLLRFRCRVGHQFSPDSLLSEQGEALDAALWAGFRALEERAALNRRLQARSVERGERDVATRFERRAEDARRSASVLHDLLQNVEAGRTLEGEDAA